MHAHGYALQQQVAYEPIAYNHGVVQKVAPLLPPPLFVNPQFIPRQVTPSNGHIITIPPISNRYGLVKNTKNTSAYPPLVINPQNSSNYVSSFTN